MRRWTVQAAGKPLRSAVLRWQHHCLPKPLQGGHGLCDFQRAFGCSARFSCSSRHAVGRRRNKTIRFSAASGRSMKAVVFRRQRTARGATTPVPGAVSSCRISRPRHASNMNCSSLLKWPSGDIRRNLDRRDLMRGLIMCPGFNGVPCPPPEQSINASAQVNSEPGPESARCIGPGGRSRPQSHRRSGRLMMHFAAAASRWTAAGSTRHADLRDHARRST